jgi:hypothetical protein
VVAAAFVCAGLPAVASAATLSDGYAGRETVHGLPVAASGSNVGAGIEVGEPVLKPLSPAGHSVWLEWEAEATGFVTVSTCGSAVPTVFGVYEGPDLEHLAALGSVANFGIDCAPLSHGVTFKAFAGHRYEILLDGNNFFVPPGSPSSGEGAISLRIEATPPPANDDFADATELVGRTSEEPDGARFYFLDVFGHNWGATSEMGEPVRALGPDPASVWYRWTAPEAGLARIGVGGAFGRQIWLGVYTGESLGLLQEVGAGADFVQLTASAGTTYRIAVDGGAGAGADAMGAFAVRVSMRLAPGPDESGPSAVASVAPDRIAPETTISKHVLKSRPPIVVFSFGSNEQGVTYRCSLDRKPFAACGSSRRFRRSPAGSHKLRVFAVDSAGNADPTPATARFSIPKPRRTR